MKRYFLTILTAVFCSLTLLATPLSKESIKRSETFVSFRVDSPVIDPNLDDNGIKLDRYISNLKELLDNHAYSIISVEFCGMASPEGVSVQNVELSYNRMKALERYVRARVDIPDSLIKYNNKGVAWDYLDSLISKSDVEYKEEVLDIIRNVPIYTFKGLEIVGGKKKSLMEHNYGRTWGDMYRRFFAPLRRASAVIVTYREIDEILAKEDVKPVLPPTVENIIPEADTIVENKVDSVEVITVVPTIPIIVPPVEKEEEEVLEVEEEVIDVHKDTLMVEKVELSPIEEEPLKDSSYSPFMAIKTNLLSDVIAIPHLGIEFNLGRNWSLGFNWMFAWWHNDQTHFYWRFYGGDMFVRKYFGKQTKSKAMTGHHIGAYGQISSYDFELGHEGYLSEPWSYGGGLEYGYSAPLAKRLNLDFTIGIGYYHTIYKEYIPIDDHYVWQATKLKQFVGPTKAEISLVWLIGPKN